MSAVKKHLSKETIVILDNLTYIKGFRYQLFCEAKALLTNSCVVQVGAPVDQCREWNATRGADGWAADLFEALVFRYEEPNGMSRWDSPLYTISYDDTELPVPEIWESLVLNKPKPPNQATVLVSTFSGIANLSNRFLLCFFRKRPLPVTIYLNWTRSLKKSFLVC